MRDNFHHASIATTSIYLQSDEVKRVCPCQMTHVFAARLRQARAERALPAQRELSSVS